MEKNDAMGEPVYTGKQLQIMEAAEKLIAHHGFDGTSVRDIAQQAGVNVAMISYYFGSKEKLLDAIIAHRMTTSGMMLEHLLHSKDLSPVEKIRCLIDRYVDRMMEHPHYHKIIIRQQVTGGLRNLSADIADIKMRNTQIVKSIIAEGIRKKVFCRTVDVTMMMSTMFGTFYQVLSNQEFYRRSWNAETLDEQAFQAMLSKKLKSHLQHLLLSALTHEA